MRRHVLACCLLAAGGLISRATTAIAQQSTDNLKAAESSGTSDAKPTLEKSALPRASRNFKSQTKILDGYISGGGIIERIEGDTIHLLSGDRIKVPKGIPVIPHYRDGSRTRILLGTDVLERGMAISYTLRDGRLERMVIAGVVDEPFGNAPVYDKIKSLGLQEGSVNTTGIDPRYSIRLKGKDGEVEINAGETRLIQLAEPVMVIEWRAAEFKPEGVEDIEPFDYILVEYRENGRITFTCYATPADPKADRGDDGGKGEKDESEVGWIEPVGPAVLASENITRMIPLRFIAARQWFGTFSDVMGRVPLVAVAMDERANTLVVVGPPEFIRVVEALHQRLDTAIPADTETPLNESLPPIEMPSATAVREFLLRAETSTEQLAKDFIPKIESAETGESRAAYRSRLSRAVQVTFELRQLLVRAELQSLRKQLEQIQDKYAMHERMRSDIIGFRVEELLNPSLREQVKEYLQGQPQSETDTAP